MCCQDTFYCVCKVFRYHQYELIENKISNIILLYEVFEINTSEMMIYSHKMVNSSDDNQNNFKFNGIRGMKCLILLHLKDTSSLNLWLPKA